MRIFLAVIFSSIISISFSQSHTLFGEWKSYLPYNKSYKLTETRNNIFCTAEQTIYSVDKDDFSVTFYDKTNYLNDIEVVFHEYDKYNDQLIIAYKNGNIDILRDEETINIPDIKDNTNIVSKKQLNDIFVDDKNKAYFASDFGLMQFDLKKYEFGFTCFTDFPVNTVVSISGKLYIGTDEGIYTFDTNQTGNPNDFQHWKRISTFECEDITDYKGTPVFYSGSDVYKIIGDYLVKIHSVNDTRFDLRFIKVSGDLIFVGAFDESRYLTSIFILDINEFKKEFPGCTFRINDLVIEKNGRIWFADNDQNITWAAGIDQDCHKIILNSPNAIDCIDLDTKGDKIFVASGGANKNNYDYVYNSKGFYIFDEKWYNYNSSKTEFIKNNDLGNFFNILSDGNKTFLSAYGNGLVEMDLSTASFNFYDHTNSKLGETKGNPGRVRITDMHFDRHGNLWMTLLGAERPLVLKTTDGKWFSYKMHDGSTLLAALDIDNDGLIWIKVVNKGIIVFDNKGTIEDPTDDKYVNLNNQNTNLPSNNINYMNTDLDGNVWIGTDKGPLVFECSSQVMEGKCSGTKKKTVLQGIAEYVLNEVNISCIEFDGANRKWIGTTSGLYVLNAEGDEEIIRYTSDNSPLFDNNITALAYNDESGEMIIGTEKGILSFKTETTKGEQKNNSDAYAFPNPVPPDYHGLIAFKGLARDANVKITDIEGNLVFETTAQGGQATWDGRDFRGNRVGTGVYIVFSTAKDLLDKIDAISLKIFFVK